MYLALTDHYIIPILKNVIGAKQISTSMRILITILTLNVISVQQVLLVDMRWNAFHVRVDSSTKLATKL